MIKSKTENPLEYANSFIQIALKFDFKFKNSSDEVHKHFETKLPKHQWTKRNFVNMSCFDDIL